MSNHSAIKIFSKYFYITNGFHQLINNSDELHNSSTVSVQMYVTKNNDYYHKSISCHFSSKCILLRACTFVLLFLQKKIWKMILWFFLYTWYGHVASELMHFTKCRAWMHFTQCIICKYVIFIIILIKL